MSCETGITFALFDGLVMHLLPNDCCHNFNRFAEHHIICQIHQPITVELDENLIRKHNSFHLAIHSETDLIVGDPYFGNFIELKVFFIEMNVKSAQIR